MQYSYHSLPKQQLFHEKTEGPSRDLVSASAIQCDTHLDMYQSSAVSFHKYYDMWSQGHFPESVWPLSVSPTGYSKQYNQRTLCQKHCVN